VQLILSQDGIVKLSFYFILAKQYHPWMDIHQIMIGKELFRIVPN